LSHLENVRRRPGLPIRFKFLIVTSLLLILSVGSYLFLAADIFKRDKTELVFDLTRSIVSNSASQIETLFVGINDKIKLVSLLSQDPSAKSEAVLQSIFQNESDMVFIARSDRFQELNQTLFVDPVFAQTYGTSAAFYSDGIVKKRPIPYQEIQTAGEAVWNATVPGGPPLLGYGKNVILENEGQAAAPFAIIVYVRADKILQTLRTNSVSGVFLTDQKGRLLLHTDTSKMFQPSLEFSTHPLVSRANQSPIRTGVAEFRNGEATWLGAYSRAFNGNFIVFSEVSADLAFSAVSRLLKQSLLFASIVLTLAFLAAVLFSRSLTHPIRLLMDAMAKVSSGDLTTSINVKSHDEIAVLAQSFNAMTHDLLDSREEIEQINRDLEKKIQDRTQRLTEQNQTIQQTQEALLQSSRLAAAGEIAGRAAHEVLNPLTSIITRVEKVKARLQNQSVQDARLLEEICQSWEKEYREGGLKRLVDGWAAPSQIEKGKTIWEEDLQNLLHVEKELRLQAQQIITDTEFLLKESQRISKIVQSMRSLAQIRREVILVPVHDVLRQAVQIMADLSSQSKVQIKEVYNSKVDLVEMDPDELIQSVTNLLRNSIQAIRAREDGVVGEIILKTEQRGHTLVIEIADNGVGITAQHQQKLFESQFTTKSKAEGTGLGLSISRRFIRSCGGDIVFVKSNINHTLPETVFRIELPLKTVVENEGIAA
jgi:signal transduction histidine kinase